MSYRNLATKPLNAGLKSVLKRSGHIGLGLSAFTPVLALANPTGGQVAAGQASIAAHGANGLVITQNSQSAIINWQQFNIGAGQYVQFLQPSSSSVVLNRVIGGSPSSILGSLTGNGQVFLVNTNGVYFGKGASIDTQGFLASTLGISNQNFLAHDYVFDQAGAAGATVVNDGSITAHHSGYVVLAGDYAENDGIIAAQSGHVILASGAKATLSLNGNSLINFAVNQSTLADYAGVKNAGSILADGGTVIMTADVANLLKSTVVNNTGLVEAHAISNSGGVIQLLASGGDIVNAGTLNASGTRAGQAGGQITLKGDEKTTLTDTSNIDDAGQGAKGGFVEVSGNTLSMRGLMNIGKGGRLLLDPASIEIIAGATGTAGSIGVGAGTGGNTGETKLGLGFIETQLNNGVNVDISAHGAIFNSGNVKAITATGVGGLSLKVNHTTGHIDLFGVDITIGGALTASMGYGEFGHLTAASINLNAGSNIDLAGAVKNSKGKIITQSAVSTVGSINLTAPHVESDSEFGSGGLVLTAKTGMNINGKTSIGGNLALAGETVDINGDINAVNVTAAASNGYVDLANVTATGTVTVTATGNGIGSGVHAGNINAKGLTVTAKNGAISIGSVGDASGNIAIADTDSHGHGHIKTGGLTGQNITVTTTVGGISAGYADASGVLTMAASAEGTVRFSGPGVHGAKGVNISGFSLTRNGSGGLDIAADSGGVTLNIGIGSDSGEQFQGNVLIDAYGGAVKLGRNEFVDGDLTIVGKSLAYTGKASDFILSDHGNLTLDASIGTKTAPVKYNLDLKDQGGAIRVEKSIFTADSITINQDHSASGATLQGVIFQGASDAPITVSAGKSITVNATNIGIGNFRGSSNEAGGVSIIATKNITLTAVGAGSNSGNIGIGAGSVEVGNAVGRNVSMLVQAGGSLDLHANNISIKGGNAFADANGSKGKHSAAAAADVTLKAGADLSISASSKVNIQAGRATARASGGKSVTLTASADASVNITAGKVLTVFGSDRVQISGGYGSVVVGAGKKGTATGTANAGVNLKAGGALDISGSTVVMAPGTAIARAGADTGGGITVSATATSGINLTAGTNINISAGSRVQISAGYGAASIDAPKGIKASALATADVNFKAGGSINVTATDSDIGFANRGRGSRAAMNFVVGSSSGALTAKADVSVNFTAGKAIAMTAGDGIFMSAGYGTAIDDVGGKGDVTNMSVNTGVSLTAGTNVQLTAHGSDSGAGVHLGGAHGPSSSDGPLHVEAAAGGKTTVAIHKDISINAGGSIAITGRQVTLSAGNSVGGGRNTSHEVLGVEGGGNVKLTDTANINLTAGTSVTLAASSVVAVHGGANLARSAEVVGASGGVAAADYEAAVNIKAGGTFTAHASGDIFLVGGREAGASMGIIGSSHGYGATKNTTTLNSGISITAKAVTLTGQHVQISGGSDAGVDVDERADGAKAVDVFNVNAGVNLSVAGALTVDAGSRDWFAGGSAAGLVAQVTGGSGGKAAYTANAGITVKAGSVLLSNSEAGRESLFGRNGDGVGVEAIANGGGSANLNVNAGISMTVTGAFVAQGANVILFAGNSASPAPHLGQNAEASNAGTGKATVALANGIAVSAKSVTLSANNSVEMFAGGSVADGVTAKANGGSATLSANSGISVTAAQGITVNVTGSGGTNGTHRRIVLDGGSSAAHAALVNATHGGNAALGVTEGVTFTAGGAIALKNKGVAATFTTLSGSSSSIVNHHNASHGIIVVAGSRMGAASGSHGSHLTTVQAGLGGGTATLTGNVSVNITTKGAFSMDAGSGVANITGGSSEGRGMHVGAVIAGKATAGLTGDVNLTAASAIIDGGSAVLAGGGFQDGGSERIAASHGGIATATVESALKFTITGAFGVTADAIIITSGRGSLSHGIGTGSLAHRADVDARLGGQAALNANGFVAIKAGSVTLTANDGFVHVFAGDADGATASVSAAGKGDKASLNVNGTVSVTATAGSIAITAKGTPSISNSHLGAIGISAGSSVARHTDVFAGNAGATAGLTVDTSANLTAKKAVIATASGQLHLDAGSSGIGSDTISANGKAAAANVSVTSSLNVTAANIALTAKDGNLSIEAGTKVGAITAFGSHSGHATVTDTGTVNLKASGNVAIEASAGSVVVEAGFGSFSGGHASVGASNHGVVSATALSGVSIQAGGSLTVNAQGDVRISGGFGHSASVDAQTAGAVTYTQDGSITLKAGTKAQISAGGNVLIFGGGFNRVGGNAFTSAGASSLESNVPTPNKAGGTLTANLADTVSITAGSDVDLGAGSNLVIEAGDGNQLFVGAERLGGEFVGQRWAGGNATMAVNTSVTVTAGHNLNLIAGGAGTGSLQVQGMGEGQNSFQQNQANVMGGSGSAVAKLSLIGNATLTAKNDIVINAAGDASIVGGSLGNLRDDHGAGHVTIFGSADANMIAGHDVVLNDITGSLTVAGVNVNSSHGGGILADAHASSGFASVTAHADAGITAGNSIRTVTALGGNLNVVGGQFVDAAALGHASNEQVAATASASLTAGNMVTVSATGDLTLAGGLFNSAAIDNSISSGGISASGARAASVKTRADIIAKKTVTLTIGGDAVIAGGDGLTAVTNMNGDSFETGNATADAGVSIKGSSVTVNVTGNLLMRGGSAASAKAIAFGGSVHATATATATASIAGVTNVVINAGSASFVGGSAGKASVQNLFSDNAANGTAHADVNVTAGKAITLTTTHDLKVAGGPGAENSALVFAGLVGGIIGASSIGATSGTATATVTGKVNFTAGTTLNVTAGGNIDIQGGSRGGSGAVVTAAAGSSGQGRNNTATLNVDTSVNMKGATVTLTANGGGVAAGDVNVTTFVVPASGSAVTVASNGSNNTATATINQSVNITGKTVTINGTLNKSTASSSDGIVNSGITITGHATAGFSPRGMHPMTERVITDAMHVSPMDTGASFGGVQLVPSTSVTPPAQPAAAIGAGEITVPAPIVSSLDTLQSQGLVLDLVTLLAAPAAKTDQVTVFLPNTVLSGSTGAFPSSCAALVLKPEAAQRCAAGGK